MAKLRITRTDGVITEHEITPAVEYAFELTKGKGFHKAFRDDEKQSDVYWLAWECIRRSGETVKPFGIEFVETLKLVEVLESDPLG
jgi:hypothetical protein